MLFALLIQLRAADHLAPGAADGEAQLLNGTWRFKYVPHAEPIVGFYESDFRDADWSEIKVPAHWEMEGVVEPRYATVDPGIGYYRRTVEVPEAWRLKRVMLRFDGALYGLRVWVNGRKVGDWDSSFNPVTFDVSDALNWDGKPQLIAVEVTTRSLPWEFDTMDCWALSGIFRDVTLSAVPEVHLRDYSWTTSVASDGSAHVRLQIEASKPAMIRGRLTAPDGSVVQSFEVQSDSAGEAVVAFEVSRAQLWSAETPVLHGLFLTVGDGAAAHSSSAKVGIREVSVRDGVLKLNGKPIKLRGINHHDLSPEGGRVMTEVEIRRDLELMRAANINFIRTSHYPPHARLIELCDEMGFYVMCEVPFTFGGRYLADPSFAPALVRRARATVLRDRNRPSVIMWSVGNEQPITELGTETARYVKRLDPSRPLCLPTVGPEFERDIEQHMALPEFIEVFAPHYPTHRQIALYAEKLNRPIIFTEFAHAMGLATDRLEEQWAMMREHPKIAGGALWHFHDQGILRRAERAVDVTRPTQHAWRDATHYFDTSGSAGADGIVYSDRTPQVDYWQVRSVYAPVGFDVRFESGANDETLASVEVRNLYDFRALSGYRLAWTFVVNGTEATAGVVPLSAAPHASQRLEIELPEGTVNSISWLTLRCISPSDVVIAERSFRRPSGDPLDFGQIVAAALPSAELQVLDSPSRLAITHPKLRLELDKRNGATEIRSGTGELLARGLRPHVGRKLTMAEEERTTKSAVWRGSDVETEGSPLIELRHTAEGVRVSVHASYMSPPQPRAKIVGVTSITVLKQGVVKVDYDFKVEGGSGQVLEAGLSLACPGSGQALRWVGHGPFPGYPGKSALNNFGVFALSDEDLNFQGNRRHVELALLTRKTGLGLALFCAPSDIAVERIGEAIKLRHNSVVSGRGNTDIGPEFVQDGARLQQLAGSFSLVALEGEWPPALRAWFSAVLDAPSAFRPFVHSYDQ